MGTWMSKGQPVAASWQGNRDGPWVKRSSDEELAAIEREDAAMAAILGWMVSDTNFFRDAGQ